MMPTLRPYQRTLLDALDALGLHGTSSLLDVGCGPAVLLEAAQARFRIPRVVGVDVVARRAAGVNVPVVHYDGVRLPFVDRAVSAVTMINVLHHVDPAARAALLAECARVSGHGPLYLKDHVQAGALDRARLTFLDVVGNWAQGGMVHASYLDRHALAALLGAVGYADVARDGRAYRGGVYGWLLPNRLEIFLRLEATA